MYATLARATDKSRLLVLLHAEVSLRSAVSYCFLVALYGGLYRAKCQQKQHTIYKISKNICLRHWQDHMFATLARSSYESAGSSKMRGAASSMFVCLRPLPSPFLPRKAHSTGLRPYIELYIWRRLYTETLYSLPCLACLACFACLAYCLACLRACLACLRVCLLTSL